MKTLITVALTVLATSTSAFADYEGKILINGSGLKSPLTATAFGKGTKMRWDMDVKGIQMSMILDYKTRTGALLLPQQRVKKQLSAQEMAEKGLTQCPSGDFTACLKSQGYKNVGTEKILGHSCSIFEGTEKNGNQKAQVKFWRPDDLKDVFMLKSLVQTGKNETKLEFTSLTIGNQSAEKFEIPKGFMELPVNLPMPGAGR